MITASEKTIGGGDQARVRIGRAIFGQSLAVGHELLGVENGWLVRAFVVAVQPGQDDADFRLIAGDELPARDFAEIGSIG